MQQAAKNYLFKSYYWNETPKKWASKLFDKLLYEKTKSNEQFPNDLVENFPYRE